MGVHDSAHCGALCTNQSRGKYGSILFKYQNHGPAGYNKKTNQKLTNKIRPGPRDPPPGILVLQQNGAKFAPEQICTEGPHNGPSRGLPPIQFPIGKGRIPGRPNLGGLSPAVPIWEDSTHLLGITPQAKGWNPPKLGRPGILPFPI